MRSLMTVPLLLLLATATWSQGVTPTTSGGRAVRALPVRRAPGARPVRAGRATPSTRPAQTPADRKPGEEDLDASVVVVLEKVLASGPDPRPRAHEVWRACSAKHGSLDPLLRELDRRVKEAAADRKHELLLMRLKGRILRRLGDLSRARTILQRIEPDERTVPDLLALAEVLDARGRRDKALQAYDRLLERELDPALKNRILLRQALMRKKEGDGPSPLAKFAGEEGRDPALRNQAAIALAMRGEVRDAIRLFQVSGEGTKRYRQETRLAEWALEAEDWKAAQEFAWKATQSARTRRDRRYVLSILVEAYRRDDALGRLVDRFAAEPQLDEEARKVWIDLLRETGRVEQALELFRTAAKGRFTVEMRRELLEMCRETGQDGVLVDAYGKLISEEPRFLEWREGLSRFHLERGDKQAALEVWKDYQQVTQDVRYLLAAASTLMGLGLDEEAEHLARAAMKTPEATGPALLFLFELHHARSREKEARAVLEELDGKVAPEAPARKDLAEAWARLGDKKKAVAVLAALREARGSDFSSDLDMKLALMLSEVGEEEQALDRWYELWGKTTSIPRRRYVEERLMTVASRLGKLAQIAVRLEQKLTAGKAGDREAGLLVRLYTRVNDPVSATEIVEEHMRRSGKKRQEVLAEKARVFLSCDDYFNYEETIKELIEVDEEGRPDYLRQLAMSKLERGKRDEARVLLDRLKKEEGDSTSDEFEAGVLSLAGLRDEALAAYRRSLAHHPERIDTYLLLSNVQKELGRHTRSAGMFQFLSATAEKDDLFTVAIDGILNMRDGRTNRGAPDRLVEWARRVVLERLARRPDKLYLHQLVADLSDEIDDKKGAIRALKAALPIAGEQRTSLLRELMSMASSSSRSSMSMVIIMTSSGVIRRGGEESKSNTEQLMFGRRLLGQGELVPPQVYLDLGEAFLAAGDVINATKTFNQASQLPEFAGLQRKIAQAFEKARYPKEALAVYQRILSVETSDIGLITKVGELQEQLGRDDVALELYRRGLKLYLDGRPFETTVASKKTEGPVPIYGGGNVEESVQHYEWLEKGFLATCPAGDALEAACREFRADIDADLARLRAGKRPEKATLDHFPRLRSRAALYRRVTLAAGRVPEADAVDAILLLEFPDDEKLLEQLVRYRLSWGFVVSARGLIGKSGRPDEQKGRMRLLAGGSRAEDVPGVVKAGEAATLLLPLIVRDERQAVRLLLERLDLSTGEKADLEHMPLLVSAAAWLEDPELSLGMCRHWLNLALKHSGKAIYGPAQQILQASQRSLDGQRRRSLVQSLLDAIVEKPDRFSSFMSRLPRLLKDAGPNLMSAEQVQKLIKSRLDANDRFTYGIPDLFALLPPADRATTLREVWPKIQKAQRAMFLLQLVPKLDAAVDKGFADFLVGSLDNSWKDADHKENLHYQVDDLVDATINNLELVLRLIEVLKQKDPDQPVYQVEYALGLNKQGRKDDAWKAAQAASRRLMTSSSKEYRSVYALNRLIAAFADDHLQDLQKLIDEQEEKAGPSEELTTRRLDLIARKKDPDALLKAMREATAKHPKAVKLWQRLRRQLTTMGHRFEVVSVQEKILELEPKKKRHRSLLVSDWRRLRNPVKALEVTLEGEKQAKEDASVALHKKERRKPPSMKAVKEAWEKGEADRVRTEYRRLWRTFPDRTNTYSRFNFNYMAGRRRYWPRDEKKPDPAAKKKKVKRNKGGFPEYFDKTEKEEKEAAEKRKKERPELESAVKVLVGRPYGRDEVLRQLRSMTPSLLDSVGATDIYKTLAALDVKARGRAATIAALLEKEREGLAGRKEYGMLFGLLEEAGAEDAGSVQSTLEGLLKTVNARDSAALRRMARLYAKLGAHREAGILYRWTAIRQGGSNYYGSASSVLNEVIENLKGEERDRAVQAILEFSRPNDDYYWGQDGYERMVIDTWIKLIGPQKALEKTRALCDGMTKLGQMPRRNAAKRAAFLFAHAGETDQAIKCLEVALCKLEPTETLQYPYYKSYFSGTGYVSRMDMRSLFPRSFEGWKNPADWLSRASAAISDWVAKERMNETYAFQLMTLIAKRLHQSGSPEAADAALKKARELAGSDASRLLWIIDVARAGGREQEAAELELKLLREQRLHVERIPDVIARVRKSQGDAEALALGEKVAAFSLHPDLLKTLIATAMALNRTDRAEHWTTLEKKAEAALATFEERARKKQKNG